MVFLINASNLKQGGGIQVADSICRLLKNFQEHSFVVVLSSRMRMTRAAIEGDKNIEVFEYDITNSVSTLLFGRDTFLDGLVVSRNVNRVLTVFGPSRWNPKCPHLCGFARSHLVLLSSPYFQQMKILSLFKAKMQNRLLKYLFVRSTRFFYTENPYISELVGRLFHGSSVYTVTNYYNQIYDQPELWLYKRLPDFEGTTLLTITANYPHKNLPISIEVVQVLKKRHPGFQFRFVFTIDESQFPVIPKELHECFVFIGRVDISECPSLYRQAEVMFQPTLLECFTATYPEAMKMSVPIVTVDMEFARGLCGDAALYYSPLSAEAAAEAIYKVATDEELRKHLLAVGKKQLNNYDTYEERTGKLIRLMEDFSV